MEGGRSYDVVYFYFYSVQYYVYVNVMFISKLIWEQHVRAHMPPGNSNNNNNNNNNNDNNNNNNVLFTQGSHFSYETALPAGPA